MHVNPEIWEAKSEDYLRSGVQDHSDQCGEILSLLKIQKLSGHGGACLSSLGEAEAGESLEPRR